MWLTKATKYLSLLHHEEPILKATNQLSKNSAFVTDSTKYFLDNKLVKETNNTPEVVSPLPVAEKSAGKND